ncbi:MAG: hypothetical protein GQ581_08545 [Methyloprofundus sp.]|nr:hypothetical protein [Methyloprofundus sp.]
MPPSRPPHHNSKGIRDNFFAIANPKKFDLPNDSLGTKINLDINLGLEKIIPIIGKNSAAAVNQGYQHAPDEIKANILSTISITIAIQEVAKNLNITLDECTNLTHGSFLTEENIESCCNNNYASITEETLDKLGYAPIEIIALGLLQVANIRIMDKIYQQTSTS